MTRHRFVLAVPLCCLAASVDAFSLGSGRATKATTAFSRGKTLALRRQHSTCLRAEADERAEAETAASNTEEDHGEHTGEEWQLPDEASADILNSPAFLKRKIDVLKSDIDKADEEMAEASKLLEAGKAEWGSQLDELQKEYAMMQERMTKQSKEGGGVATVEVARKMLDVLDNYDRAFGAVTAETEEEKEIEAAYKKTYQMILDTFEELGIKEVETVGLEFDYEVHQAVMVRPSEYDEGIVCEELAKGYVLDNKLIRAAMVSVAG